MQERENASRQSERDGLGWRNGDGVMDSPQGEFEASHEASSHVLAEENGERLDAVGEKLLDFCYRKLSRRDFGVPTCEVRSSFFS
jgi:hypothetical protein